MASSLPPAHRAFARWMSISAALYGAGGLAFALFPAQSHGLPDQALRLLPGLESWEPLPAAAAHNWTVLAVAMMASITACAVLAARKPVANRDMAIPILVSKSVSSILGLLFLAFHARHAFYLAIFLTDFPLFVVTALLWRRAAREESP